MHLNPWLRSLPRLSLSGLPPSQYHIRKGHGADQRSTLEATCAALAMLEGVTGEDGRYQSLLQGFEGFVASQAAWQRGKRRDPD